MPGRQKPQPMTLTQKILAHHAVTLPRPWAQTGDMLRIRVDWTIASELAWNGMDRTYTLLGRPKIANPDALLPGARPHRRPGDAGQRSPHAQAGQPLARLRQGKRHHPLLRRQRHHHAHPLLPQSACSRARSSSARTRIPARMAAWARSPLAWAARM